MRLMRNHKRRFLSDFAELHSSAVALLEENNAKTVIRNVHLSENAKSPFKSKTEMMKAFQRLEYMDQRRIKPESSFYTRLLQLCAKNRSITLGKLLHSHAIQTRSMADVYVNNGLINMYVKCGFLKDASEVFDHMPFRDVVSWTAMITGCTQHGQSREALDLLCQMSENGIQPNQFTFAIAIKACALLLRLSEGKQIHRSAIVTGLKDDISSVSLVDMYAKCGALEDAYKLFDKMPVKNSIAWNSMIAGYAQHGKMEEALRLFRAMPEVDEFSWSSLISGCSVNGLYDDALKHFVQMRKHGYKATEFAFGSLTKACADGSYLQQGKQLHAQIIKFGFDSDHVVGNAIVAMYGRCGRMEDAQRNFSEMRTRNVVSWSSMIVGFAQHGKAKEAIQLFHEMLKSGVCPNEITYIGVLSACSHAGLVADATKYFECMTEKHGIRPLIEHYICMIDVLGRAGFLVEAENLIRNMPFQPTEHAWAALLSACRIHGNVEIAKRVEGCLLELEIRDGGTYALLANIYAEAGRWDDVANVRKVMRGRGVRKLPGLSWIESRNQIHTFVVGDTSHPMKDKIYGMLDELAARTRKEGYTPDTRSVLQNVGNEQKEHAVGYHSEKLALAFGLINTLPGTTIHIVKNLRVCTDCHNFIKVISKMVGRDIVLRDHIRFHHFKDGQCSCGDYW